MPCRSKTRKPLHRLDCTGLVVRKHQRCQTRLFAKLCSHELSIGDTFGIDRWPVHTKFLSFEAGHCLSDRRMLDRTGNHMPRHLIHSSQAEYCQVVGFSSA